MRKLMLVVCSLVLCVNVSMAQKIASQWKCDAKAADEHSIAVPDKDGHAYHISQGKCPPEKPAMGALTEQEGMWTEFEEIAAGACTNPEALVAPWHGA